MKWIWFEDRAPKDGYICDVLLETGNSDLEEELAVYYEDKGTFILRATEDKPCGSGGRVLYWKEEESCEKGE